MITDANSHAAPADVPCPAGLVQPGAVSEFRLPRGSVAEDLFAHPWKFDFFEAVLLLHEMAAAGADGPAATIGRFSRPSCEAMRFAVPHTLAFPAAAIQAIHWDPRQRRPRVQVAFMGLTGPSGTLPRCYNERLQQIDASGGHAERNALRDWLDNLNHRMISLFFDAWAKYRYPVSIRRSALQTKQQVIQPASVHVALASIGGIDSHCGRTDTPASGDTQATAVGCAAVARDELLGLAGVLAQRPMTVSNLRSAIEQCLGVPATVKQFEGCWLALDDDTRTRLGVEHCALGHDAVLGERIWNRQQKIVIEVGPLSAEQFQRFLPPSAEHAGDGYQRLSQLVRVCIGPVLQFDLCPVLKVDRPLEVALSAACSRNRLGIDSWLGAPPDAELVADAVFAGG